jgi:hypothetical protein
VKAISGLSGIKGSNYTGWVIVSGAVTLSLLAGLAIGTGHAMEASALLLLTFSLTLGVFNWRRSIYGLLAYLPFSGIPIIVSYPRTAVAVLMKDALFVIPAYLGFLVNGSSRRGLTTLKSRLPVPLVLLAILIVAQAFNPLLPNWRVGAIGIKVWLLYVPLWVLGYHLVTDRTELNRILAVMSVGAVIPVLIGLAEAIAIYSGRPDLVYRLYGDAASAATQDFAVLAFEKGGTLLRVPSTFSFVAQYFAFTISMSAITYAWWRSVLRRTKWSLLGVGLWMLTMLAGFLSGARAAFFFIPLLISLLFLLEKEGMSSRLARLLPVATVLPLAVAVFGGSLTGLLIDNTALAIEHFNNIFLDGFRKGFEITLMGLGTGIDTNASRYAFSSSGRFAAVGGVWYESWYVKALLELGVAGLLLVVLIFSILLVETLRRHFHVRDRQLKTVSASLVALLAWNIIYCIKGQYLDLDPMNVYFWLFAGMVMAIPRLDLSGSTTLGGEHEAA